jgi:hypothetical protein
MPADHFILVEFHASLNGIVPIGTGEKAIAIIIPTPLTSFKDLSTILRYEAN